MSKAKRNMSHATMSNYLTTFERWQKDKYGNIIPETEINEEYEYLNIENKERCEWTEKQAENEIINNETYA